MPRIAFRTRRRTRRRIFLSAARTLREFRVFLEEIVITTVTLWGLYHVVKILFFWAA